MLLCEIATSYHKELAFKISIQKFLGPTKSFRVLFILKFCFDWATDFIAPWVSHNQLHWKTTEAIGKNQMLWQTSTKIRKLPTEAGGAL